MPLPLAVAAIGGGIAGGILADSAKDIIRGMFRDDWVKNRERLIREQQPPGWFVKAGDYIAGYDPNQPLPPPQAGNNGAVVFTGGQCATQYRIIAQATVTGNGGQQFTTDSREFIFTGPIGSIEFIMIGTGPRIRVTNGDTGVKTISDWGILYANESGPYTVTGTASVTGRVDGQPDNCGNPPNVNYNNNYNTTNNYYYGDTYNTTVNFPPLPSINPTFNPSFNPKIGPISLPSPTLNFDPEIDLPDLPDIPNIPQALADILDSLNDLVNNPGQGGGTGGTCNFQPTNLSEVLSRLNHIIDLIEALEDGNGQQPITTTINLDYVTENQAGERNLQSQALTVVNPPSGVVQLFNESAEIALTDRIKIRKILAILGGNNWIFNNQDDTVELIFNPENKIRTISEESYTVDASDNEISEFTSKDYTARNIYDLVTAINSVNYMRGGLWKYPTEVKDSIIERLADMQGIDPIQDITLHDSQDYQEWLLQQLEEILGQWHNKLVIKDVDPLQEGDQTQEIVLHSISDAFTELLTLEVANSAYLKALLNANTRLAMETVAIKKEAVCNKFMLDAILDYLGCNTAERKIKLPTLFKFKDVENPSDNWGLLDFLDTDEKEIAVTEYKDTKNFQFSLVSLLQAAAITKAALATKLPSQLTDFISQFNAESELENTPEGQQSDFDKFIEEVENQYSQTLDTSVTEPYGRPVDQRPRIIEVKPTDNEPNPF